MIVVIFLVILVLGIFLSKGPLLESIGFSTPTLGIGSKMVSKIDGVTMMYIPTGEFSMGFKDFDPTNNS